jgi:hypothetical protein
MSKCEAIDLPAFLPYTIAHTVQIAFANGQEGTVMQGPLRGIIAGLAAWKLGGGCISTIVIFILVYYFLGKSC